MWHLDKTVSTLTFPTRPTFRPMHALSNASDEGDDQAIRIQNLEKELLARRESQESGEGEERTDESSRTLEMGSARSTAELRITSWRSASIDMERMKNLEKEVEKRNERTTSTIGYGESRKRAN